MLLKPIKVYIGLILAVAGTDRSTSGSLSGFSLSTLTNKMEYMIDGFPDVSSTAKTTGSLSTASLRIVSDPFRWFGEDDARHEKEQAIFCFRFSLVLYSGERSFINGEIRCQWFDACCYSSL